MEYCEQVHIPPVLSSGRESGMHHFLLKRTWRIYSIMFVFDILYPKVLSLMCRVKVSEMSLQASPRRCRLSPQK